LRKAFLGTVVKTSTVEREADTLSESC